MSSIQYQKVKNEHGDILPCESCHVDDLPLAEFSNGPSKRLLCDLCASSLIGIESKFPGSYPAATPRMMAEVAHWIVKELKPAELPPLEPGAIVYADRKWEVVIEGLRRIVKKQPHAVSIKEAADMAVEYKMIAAELLRVLK